MLGQFRFGQQDELLVIQELRAVSQGVPLVGEWGHLRPLPPSHG